MRSAAIFVVVAVVALAMLACSPGMVSKRSARVELPQKPRVAVLPFENYSGEEGAATRITDYFVTLMTASPDFELIEFGSAYEAMRRLRIRSSNSMSSEQIDSLAAILSADVLFSGTVVEYNTVDNSYLGKVPRVAFNARALATSERRTVWSAAVSGRGDKGEFLFGIGVIRSAEKLSEKLVEAAVREFADEIRK